MTIETNLQSIADSLKLIADLLTVQTATKTVQNAPTIQAPQPAPTPIPTAVTVSVSSSPEPVVAAVAAPAVVVPVAAPVMPATPVFTQAAPSPFTDKSAMMDYVLATYKALGAEKGAKIQDVLVALGYNNINDVPSEKWADLKAGIEALKG